MSPLSCLRALLGASLLLLLAAQPAAAEWRPVGDRTGDFADLQVLPGEPPVLLAVQDGALWRLPHPDGVWEQVPVPPPADFTDDQGFEFVVSNPQLVAVWAAPRDASHLLAAFTYDVEIFAGGQSITGDDYSRLDESHDGGDTWTTVSAQLPQPLAVASSQPDLLYAQLFDTTRNGGGIRLVRIEPGDHEVVALRPLPIPLGLNSAVDLAVDAADPAMVYAASVSEHLFVSRDQGDSWGQPVFLPAPTAVAAIAAHPSIAGTALVGISTGEVFRTTDGWSTFEQLADLPSSLHRRPRLVLDPVDAGRYYALVEGAAFVSDDAGVSWQPLPTDGLPSGAEIVDLDVDPADTSRLFASIDGEGVWLLDRRFPAVPCVADATTLCLGEDGRFAVRVLWQNFTFKAGHGRAVPLEADDTGAFWFFAEDNLELVVKALDGRPVNGFHWVFYGSLTNVPFSLMVTDTATGETVGYRNPTRHFASRGDTTAFPEGGFNTEPPPASLTAPVASVVAASPCVPGPTVLCLAGGRFQVEVEWTGPAGGGGAGTAVPLTDDTGAFWFFREDNLELAVKVLDGRPVNGHRWVFYGSLTHVAFELRVTDTETGRQLLYENPPGEMASRGDTSAFPAAGP